MPTWFQHAGSSRSPVAKLYGDGAYDKWKLYDVLAEEEIQPVIPPRRRASIRHTAIVPAEPLPRDEAIRGIRRLGRKGWKRASGYHRRSLVETSMSRLKRAFGNRLKNKGFENQQTEARLRCKLLNRFTQLGLATIHVELGDKALSRPVCQGEKRAGTGGRGRRSGMRLWDAFLGAKLGERGP